MAISFYDLRIPFVRINGSAFKPNKVISMKTYRDFEKGFLFTMKAVIIFESQFGNTGKVARAISDTLKKHLTVQLVNINDPLPQLDNVNLVIMGCPTQKQGLSAPMCSYLEKISDLNGIWAVAFDTRHRGPKLLSGSAAPNIARQLRQKGATLLAEPESFFCVERESSLYEGELNRAVEWTNTLVMELKGLRV
jgi:flavodoxin